MYESRLIDMLVEFCICRPIYIYVYTIIHAGIHEKSRLNKGYSAEFFSINLLKRIGVRFKIH